MMVLKGETHTLLKEGDAHPFFLLLPYLQLSEGGNAHFIGRGGDGGQRQVETLEKEHEFSFLSVVEVSAGSIETH
jgi:hypothetical protein